MKYLLTMIFFLGIGFLGGRYYNQNAEKDMSTLAQGYGSMFNMCEAKYQAALRGDINTATVLKDDITQAQANINKLLK